MPVASSSESADRAGGKRCLKVFVSCDRTDWRHRDELLTRLESLAHVVPHEVWHDGMLEPGAKPHDVAVGRLGAADVVILLVSPDFMAPGGCFTSQAKEALEQYEDGRGTVVPILIRPEPAWKDQQIGALQTLPKNATPVAAWSDPDEAWASVTRSLLALLLRLSRSGGRDGMFPGQAALVARCAERLFADRRLMLLAPWRAGLEELGDEIAGLGDAVTTLRIPIDVMDSADFYAGLSGEPAVSSSLGFLKWLKARIAHVGNHVVVLPYFDGPHELVRELGIGMGGLFETIRNFCILVLGRHRCAELRLAKDPSLFSGIATRHAPDLDVAGTGRLLEQLGADPRHAPAVHEAAGGHPEWTALLAPDVQAGRLADLDNVLADSKVYGVLFDRLMLHESDRQGESHAANTLHRLLTNQPVRSLEAVRDDLAYPEVRLYYDGVVCDREGQTVFRCEAARMASERVLELWRTGT
jgi:hypothetical protein